MQMFLRQAGFRVDDDLTRLQQQERRSSEDDFATLKANMITGLQAVARSTRNV